MMEHYPWYLLYCKKNEQERAEQHLKRQGVECYYPQVLVEKIRRGKKSAKLEPLFPNYLFVSFDTEKITFTTVRSTRGVANFIRIGPNPCVVPRDLVMTLMSKEDNEEQRTQLSEAFSQGEAVDIIDGPYRGAEAIYKESDGEKRSILLINMLNQQVELTEDNKRIKKK